MNRVDSLDWSRLAADLDNQGWAVLPGLLTAAESRDLAGLYDRKQLFRSRVEMERHGFGRGEYQYLAYPLPEPIAGLRTALYPHLAAIANRWQPEADFPSDHGAFLTRCHRAGQKRPTPLLLRYGEGDYNCLHQDLYGEHVFPLQTAILLSQPGEDFTGGEFVLTEQRPRRQSRPSVVPLSQGDAVIFAVHHRPNGKGKVTLRHGVSTVRSGSRHVAGIIFHDAL